LAASRAASNPLPGPLPVVGEGWVGGSGRETAIHRGDAIVYRTSWQWFQRLALFLLLATAMAACGSPEDGRARGGGPGADVGNKAANFKPDSKVFQ
jgi:hypothetical protein